MQRTSRNIDDRVAGTAPLEALAWLGRRQAWERRLQDLERSTVGDERGPRPRSLAAPPRG